MKRTPRPLTLTQLQALARYCRAEWKRRALREETLHGGDKQVASVHSFRHSCCVIEFADRDGNKC